MKKTETAADILKAARAQAAAQAQQGQRSVKKINRLLAELRELSKPGALQVAKPGKKRKQFAKARVADVAEYVAEDTDLDFSLHDLARHDDVLKGFANAAARKHNLENIWERNLRPLIGNNVATEHDNALAIAENSSDTGLGLTSLSVAHKDRKGFMDVVPVHIVSNDISGKALVVGEKIPSKLRKAFAKSGVHYVDRTAEGADVAIDRALKKVLGEQDTPVMRSTLLDAFKYRYDVTSVDGLENAPVQKALAHPTVEPMYPKYVVKQPRPEKE